MTLAKRSQATCLEVRLLREGIPESSHVVHAVVTDTRGRVLSYAGDPQQSTFSRSALKPFQALAAVSTGTLEHFQLGDRDLAVMCASHQGLVEQTRQVFRILWQADVDAVQLQCPTPAGRQSALEHGCSGKHAGMLATSQKCEWPLKGYLNGQHPVQQMILGRIGEILGMPGAEFIAAHDDCGAPTYLMQLTQLAALYAHMGDGKHLDLEQVARAMMHHPELVAGPGCFDTELMRAAEGELISKSGAEGVQCLSRVGEGLGLAIKVTDGSRRAKVAAAIHALHQLGWISPSVRDVLGEQFLSQGPYTRLEVLGELTLP